MCTVTWLVSARDGSFDLLCNRDERHERAEAAAPRVLTLDGVAVVAPRDPDGGGTWIAVNEHGVALCLLNGYRADDDLLPAERFRSRGLLVRDVAPSATAAEALRRLAAADLTPYRSFEVLALDASGPRLACWDRAVGELAETEPHQPLVSCPVRTDEVRAARRATLAEIARSRGGLDVAALAAFHRSRHADDWIWSVAMEHDKAATRSHCHVRVSQDDVRFEYVPGRPDLVPPLPAVTIRRRQTG